jgi:hypothetical protein
MADDDVDAAHRGAELAQRGLGLVEETRPQQQVFGG